MTISFDAREIRAQAIRTCVVLALASSAAILQGCGGGAATTENAAPAQGGSTTTEHAPTISGTPVTAGQVGKSYSFTPQASDADGDKLTFSITNKPAWASFDTSTGSLSGSPTVGTFANVTITVSDGQQSASLSAFSIAVTAAAAAPPTSTTGSAQLAWTPPTTHTDGSAFTDLKGYHLVYGTSQGNYTESITVPANVTTYLVENLKAGVYYFALTSFDSSGLESGFSAAVSKTIQ